jgi:hypothetical protein
MAEIHEPRDTLTQNAQHCAAFEGAADRDLARSVGFERYLLKPIAVTDLSDLLELK